MAPRRPRGGARQSDTAVADAEPSSVTRPSGLFDDNYAPRPQRSLHIAVECRRQISGHNRRKRGLRGPPAERENARSTLMRADKEHLARSESATDDNTRIERWGNAHAELNAGRADRRSQAASFFPRSAFFLFFFFFFSLPSFLYWCFATAHLQSGIRARSEEAGAIWRNTREAIAAREVRGEFACSIRSVIRSVTLRLAVLFSVSTLLNISVVHFCSSIRRLTFSS